MFTYAIKRAREIGKFHVAVVQRMLRKKRYARAKLLFCCYKKTYCFFALLVAVAVVVKFRLVVSLKFCYHGNVTSHFSSLLKTFKRYFDWPDQPSSSQQMLLNF